MIQKLGDPVWKLADISGKVRREATPMEELAPSLVLIGARIQHGKLT